MNRDIIILLALVLATADAGCSVAPAVCYSDFEDGTRAVSFFVPSMLMW
jgi:hypothetical protein